MVESAEFSRKNLLSKIFYEKTHLGEHMLDERQLLQNDRCLLKRDPSLLKLMKSEHIFLVASQPLASFLLAFMSMFEKGRSIWLSEQIVQEYNLVSWFFLFFPFVFSLSSLCYSSFSATRCSIIQPAIPTTGSATEPCKSLSTILECTSETVKKFFADQNLTASFLLLQSGIRYLEAGLVENALHCAAYNAETSSRDSIKLFKSVTEFLDANSGFDNLVLGNFRNLFAGYLAILSLTFIAFCLHRLVWLLKKNRIYLQPAGGLTQILGTLPRIMASVRLVRSRSQRTTS